MGWVDDLIIKLSGGHFSIAGLLNVSAGSIVTEKDKFVTSKGVTKVIQITQMPYHYTQEIITDITQEVSKMDSSILVNTYIEADRCVIPINHPTFLSKANKALQKYVEINDLYSGLGDIHKRSGVFKHNGVSVKSFGKEDVIKAKQTADSYTEVRNNIRRNGAVYYLTRLFIHLTFPDHHTANAHYESIFNLIDSMANKSSRVNKKMGTYLLNMSPSVTNVQNINSTNILASHESLTNLIPYRTQGLVSTRGILIGTDQKKKAPFYLDAYGTDEGSSVLINGGAGSGKTAFAQHMAIQAIVNDTTTIMLDLKGQTVGPALGQLMDNYEVINFSGKRAKFINPLILDIVNKGYTMEEAIRTTAAQLMIMVGLTPDEGNEIDLENMLKAAIRGYYSYMKVDDANPRTYHLTKDMTLGTIIDYLGKNRNQTDNPDEIKMYGIASKRISSLLHEYGMDTNENAIDITTLYDRDTIVFDFDKDKETSITRIDAIRIFSVIFFSKQMSTFNKANNRFTMLFADEGNQYISFDGLMEYISDFTARARSSNASVVFITNDLSVVSRDEMSGFRSNIAVYIAGKVVEDDLKLMGSMTNSPKLVNQVNQIKRHPGKYKHCFAVYSSLNGHAVNAIVRADIPPDVAKAFRTRTIVS